MSAPSRPDLTAWRRHATGLASSPARSPIDVVRARLAVQAQDHRPTLWSVGQRGHDLTEADLDAAFDIGDLIRTHVLRPTWHLVAPEDLRWLLALTAPRVHQANGTIYRQVGLDMSIRDRAAAAIADGWTGGQPMTRSQLFEVLADEGLPHSGIAGAYLVMHAELEQVICSGPLHGRQHTYVPMDDRIPSAASLDHRDAVARLVRRYLLGHGPATIGDLAWWSSLTRTTLRAALDEMGDEVRRFDIDGAGWLAIGDRCAVVPPSPQVDLLATFDEYLLGFSDTRDLVLPAGETGPSTNTVALDGLIIGRWRRRLRARHADMEVTLDIDLTEAQRAALDEAVDPVRHLHRASWPGAALRFVTSVDPDDGFDGTMIAYEPPRLMELWWGRSRLCIELHPVGPRTRLVLTEMLDDIGGGARNGAGWHECLDRLDAVIDDTVPPRWGQRWREVHPAYVVAFGPAAAVLRAPDGWDDELPEDPYAPRFPQHLNAPSDRDAPPS